MIESIKKTIPHLDTEINLLNQLPYAISVHDLNDNIIYENSRAKVLFGIHLDSNCKVRWCSHTDNEENACPLCPKNFTRQDKQSHKIFRKLLDPEQKIRYLEFETVPILNPESKVDGFIEIIRDVTEGETQKVKNLQNSITKTGTRYFSLVKYGMSGSEIIHSDTLFFTPSLKEFLLKLSGFTFIGVLQNNYERIGLFGPLPVLDQSNYEMYAFAFNTMDKTIADPRRHKQELVILLIIFERNDLITTINRQLLNDLLLSYVFKLKNVNELTVDWFNLVKHELNSLIDSEV